MKTKFTLFLLLLTGFTSFESKAQIVINEINYNPPESGTDTLEFIELYNAGSNSIDLNGYSFTQGVTYTFPSVLISAGGYIVVAVDSLAMQNVFGVATYQWTSGGLSNGGEDIALHDNLGVLVDSVDYDDAAPFPFGSSQGEPDGGGVSIELMNPMMDNNDGNNWMPSTTSTGITVNGYNVYCTPGAQNSGSNAMLVISEIMYNPPESGTDSLEFVEIYNNGLNTTNLNGFSFSSGITFTFPQVSVNAGEYIIVAVDSNAFGNFFGISAYEWTSGGLSNGGEAITLVDYLGNVIDSVDYDDSGVWPTSPDGNGNSLTLCDVSLDNNDGSNWSASSSTTWGMVNGSTIIANPNASCGGDITPPIAINAWATSTTTILVAFDEPVNSTAENTSNYTGVGTINSAIRNTSNDTVTLTLNTPLTIGMFDTLYVDNVEDLSNNAMTTTYSFEIVFNNSVENLVISEIMYNIPGSDTLEFLELYNNGSSTIQVGGYEFTSGIDFSFPQTSIAPGGFLLLAIDSAKANSFYGMNFLQWTSGSLSNSGELLEIRNSIGNLIDSVDYMDASPWPDAADGNGPSMSLINPSFDNAIGSNWIASVDYVGQTNSMDSIWANPGMLLSTPIIEFDTSNLTVLEDVGTVTVELSIANTNGLDASVDVILGTGSATSGTDFTFTPTTVTFLAGSSTNQSVTLNINDDVDIESMETIILNLQNITNGQYGTNSQFTLNITDNDATLEQLYINEFLASNIADTVDEYSEHDDWIEIYNPNNYAVDLAGYYITDDSTDITKYQIPLGNTNTIIPANGFKLIWADNNDLQGELHTTFKLSSGGEFIGLYGSNMGVVDSLSYASQTTDVSYGRLPDGGSTWVNFTETTPGASNQTSSLVENNISFGLIAYPNPVKGTVVNFNKMVSVSVYDQIGKLCLKAININTIDVDKLTKGIYFIVSSEGETIKLIVQ